MFLYKRTWTGRAATYHGVYTYIYYTYNGAWEEEAGDRSGPGKSNLWGLYVIWLYGGAGNMAGAMAGPI